MIAGETIKGDPKLITLKENLSALCRKRGFIKHIPQYIGGGGGGGGGAPCLDKESPEKVIILMNILKHTV